MEKIEFILPNPHTPTHPILVDYHHTENFTEDTSVLVFLHGFKGFKDWGAFDQLAQLWTKKGFVVFKMNFSHNGTTPKQPQDFADLEAFGKNTITKELADTKTLIDFIFDKDSELPLRNTNDIRLVGHSRGGSTAIIYTAQDQRIKKVITLSAVSDLERRYFNLTNQQKWEKEGVVIIPNGRTKQNMPLYREFHQDFLNNPHNYSVQEATKEISKLKTPQLILHGQNDTSVTPQDAQDIFRWSDSYKGQSQTTKLIFLENADHTYNTKHPNSYQELEKLPPTFLKMANLVTDF